MTLEEFLKLPETEPYSEFICGRIVEKTGIGWDHALLMARVAALIGGELTPNRVGWAMVGPLIVQRNENRAYLPDIAFVLRAHLPNREVLKRGPLERVPDFVVEIMAPDDRPSRVAEKVSFYMRNETPLLWVVDPDERTIDVYRPGLPSTRHGAGEVISGEPVLPDFRLDVAALFAVLDE
jgi:Uma2 family endonuclease